MSALVTAGKQALTQRWMMHNKELGRCDNRYLYLAKVTLSLIN